jgi:peptide/nickel transport system permease protein
VVFLLFDVLPGDTARLTLGQQRDPLSVEATRKALRLDKPLWLRYGLYLNDLSPIGVTGSTASEGPAGIRITRVSKGQYLSLKAPFTGRSYETKRSVSVLLGQALPRTIVLGLSVMLLAVVGGIVLGVLAALKKGTWLDTGVMATAITGISMPAFFAGLVIVCLFAGRLAALHNLILPAIALGIRPLAIITLLMRRAMLDVLSRDYIRTAYARGLTKTRVVLRHALPNALNPLIAATSGWLAELLAGAFFVEYIFGWKGVGKITVDALDKVDLPVVMGAVLLTALIYIIVNLVTDMVYGVLDPRVRLNGRYISR